ncbi:carbohydrate ABC transporter permease [Parablautia muri]|uniref:Sugar ABC transporter permease n=1 Tax=Parablautia muri TaxID=2320879 RepID=A0A9X5BGI2_9FIRM|nr:sugar ABC transporter permease [Parablautia muri]NBJ93253.1 sugar ABC transporter permease [Parablautia muri]
MERSGKGKDVGREGGFWDRHTPFIMLLPAVLAVMIVSVYPTLRTVGMSFFDKSLLSRKEPFIGLANYAEAFGKTELWLYICNTLFFAIVSLILGVALAMYVAVKLIKPLPGKGFFRAMFLTPWVTPPLVASFTWRILFSENFSPINSILLRLGWIKTPISFLNSTDVFLGFLSVPLLMLVIINVWSIFPFLMVMFIAGLQTVPAELYEAATMDGAGKIKQFWKITVPCIRPVIAVSILLELIWQFNNFNISYMVTSGGPLGRTKLLAVEVYQQAFTNFRYGYASAVSVIMMLVAAIPAVLYVRSSVKELQ